MQQIGQPDGGPVGTQRLERRDGPGPRRQKGGDSLGHAQPAGQQGGQTGHGQENTEIIEQIVKLVAKIITRGDIDALFAQARCPLRGQGRQVGVLIIEQYAQTGAVDRAFAHQPRTLDNVQRDQKARREVETEIEPVRLADQFGAQFEHPAGQLNPVTDPGVEDTENIRVRGGAGHAIMRCQ